MLKAAALRPPVAEAGCLTLAGASFLAGRSTGGAFSSLAVKLSYFSLLSGLKASQPAPVLVLGRAGDQLDLGFFICQPSSSTPPLPAEAATFRAPPSPPVLALHRRIQSMASFAGSAAATTTLHSRMAGKAGKAENAKGSARGERWTQGEITG